MVSLALLPALPLLSCHFQYRHKDFFPYLIIPCFVVFNCCRLETCFFLKEERRKVYLGLKERGREMVGAKGGVSMVGMYCVREESISNKTKILTQKN